MKKTQRVLPLFLILTVALLAMFVLSCATSQGGMYGEDETLAAAGDEDEFAAEGGGDEDDVLRLLGLVETPAPTPNPEPSRTTDTKDMSAELSSLESKVAAKDRELAQLREQLSLKESLIKSKEQNLEQARSSSRSVYSGGSFRARYDEALRLYYARRYREAIAAFDELIRDGGDPTLVDNCQYWKGESYYGLGNYEQAILEFQKVFSYSDSNKLDDAQLKLGLCYLKLGNSERARREFQKLLDEYPNSEYAGRARSYLR